ncbi:GlxA family transcriptional regulator [Microbispora corallina]|uniref:AraC family transcriptional regulator n=1 Tax=Microbispora corallina TaxID=83302 RepID=A0ABQ4G2F9_9ACTN|nr:GlxA family transcriptional regulator [Microbispora corallina]GIH41210.1 AraC family transcriptional regulator [Microbispora corallina]
MATARRGGAHRVGILVYDGVKLLDVAGPSEVFSEANRMGADYRLVLCSPGGEGVVTSTGMRIPVDAAADRTARFDTVLVMGGDIFPGRPVGPELLAAVRDLAQHADRMSSICTGAFILAAAGLLDGRRATTHWRHTGTLARSFPRVSVEPDAIFVRDGRFYTSAGVTAGIDLALALLEDDHGDELARRVAQSLVVFLQRPGGQSQFSPSLRGPRPQTPALRAVFDAVAADPAGDHAVPRLAARAGMSPRHLSRLFQSEVGMSPAKYVELIRFDAAKAMLDAGHSVTAAAERAGFGSSESLRRAFVQHVGIPPRAYQQRFRSAYRGAAGEARRGAGDVAPRGFAD